MDRIYPRPVILGTDLTGLLVSIALAKAQIEHLLIGAPPDTQTLHHGETTSMVAGRNTSPHGVPVWELW